jgi:hypothetical protein
VSRLSLRPSRAGSASSSGAATSCHSADLGFVADVENSIDQSVNSDSDPDLNSRIPSARLSSPVNGGDRSPRSDSIRRKTALRKLKLYGEGRRGPSLDPVAVAGNFVVTDEWRRSSSASSSDAGDKVGNAGSSSNREDGRPVKRFPAVRRRTEKEKRKRRLESDLRIVESSATDEERSAQCGEKSL